MNNDKLKDIEDAAMGEEDPEKLKALFEEYLAEYLKERVANDEGGQKRQRRQDTKNETMKEDGEGDRRRRRLVDIENEAIMETDVYKLDLLYQEYMTEAKRQKKSNSPMQEAPTSSTSSA